MMRAVVLAGAGFVSAILLAAAEPFPASSQDPGPRFLVLEPVALPEAYWQTWREGVAAHLLPVEADVFEQLRTDEERFAFVDRFWHARDPTPGTRLNEAQRNFNTASAHAISVFPAPGDPRAEALIRLGVPQNSLTLGDCSRFDFGVGTSREADAIRFAVPHPQKGCTLPDLTVMSWAAQGERAAMTLIFYRHEGVCRRLRPGTALLPRAGSNEILLKRLEREGCFSGFPDLRRVLAEGFEKVPTQEDVKAIRIPITGSVVRRRDELVPRPGLGAAARLEIGWLGRRVREQHSTFELRPDRTRVTVASAQLELDRGALQPWPEDLPWKTISIVAELSDLERDAVSRRAFETNLFDPVAAVRIPFPLEARAGPHVLTLRVAEGDVVYDPVAFTFDVPREIEGPVTPHEEPELLEALLGAPRVRLPGDLADLVTGAVEVAVGTSGAVAKVELILGDETVAQIDQAPFSAEVDFGAVPIMRTLRAIGRSSDGRVLARDHVVVNPGAQRLGIQLHDVGALPVSRRGRMVLRPRMSLQVPHGATVDRVELFAGEVPLATLRAPPWVQTVEVKRQTTPTVLRAVLHLSDGRTAETGQVVEADAMADRVIEELEIDYVEVYASVTRRGGRSVEDLRRNEVRLFEDGVEQEVLRFERVRDLPLNVVLLADSSTSMAQHGPLVKQAAQNFLEQVVSDKDRAALIQFNTLPRVLVPLTSNRERLESAVELMWMGGGTAFRDSVVTALHYLQGARGRRALVVLTDGVDQHSLLTAREALEYAQRAGVAVYTVALGLHTSNPFALPPQEGSASFAKSRDALRALQNLADGSGGLAFNVASAARLPEAYRQIEEDLRSQYLLTFQSAQEGADFRRLRVRVSRRGVKVRSAAGYYP